PVHHFERAFHTLDLLEEHIVRLREELDREREERNYFQLERDKIHTFWEITRRQLEEKKSELRNKDREMEEAEERHQVEIKVYKQKVKHLLYEHQNNISELKAGGSVTMKLAQKEHHTQESVLRRDIRGLRVDIKEQELASEMVVKNIKKVREMMKLGYKLLGFTDFIFSLTPYRHRTYYTVRCRLPCFDAGLRAAFNYRFRPAAGNDVIADPRHMSGGRRCVSIVAIEKQDEEITRLRNDFERQVKVTYKRVFTPPISHAEIESKYEKKMQVLRDELELRRKTEIHEVEERKNGQINALMKNHEKAFSDIKNYYNDITLNNLALINSLKEQMEEMRKKEDRLEKEMADLQQQNRRLTEPLQKAREEVAGHQRQLTNYEKDKAFLISTKSRLKSAEKELEDLTWEHEVLVQRFQKIQSERDELYNKFTAAIHEVQQKNGFKNLLLERKLQALRDTLEKKEAQLNEVLAASNLDPVALSTVTRKLEDVLDTKNNAIKDLQYELARVCKAHNDLLRTYEAKMRAFGIPVEELGFKPLECLVPGQTFGQGPAGLVAAST
ncbi:unnamed protein product, partial [Ranitomeya imitator]